MQPRNKSKAEVRIEERDGCPVIVKDYGAVGNPLLRAYGILTLRNEARIYQRLRGIPGIPVCRGLTHARLELSLVPGKRLALYKRNSVPETVLADLKSIIQAMHDRGVGMMDLHRSNVLVAQDGWSVHVIDFAHAVMARDPLRPGMLARLAMRLDWHAFQRMQSHYTGCGKKAPEGAFGLLYRLLRTVKHTIRVLKRIV